MKVTLILNDEQANLLARVKQMKTAVKFPQWHRANG